MGADPPAQTTPAGCWTGSPAPTRRSSAAATPIRPPEDASPKPPTSSQPCDCSKSTATSVGSTRNPPATPTAAADRPRRGSWSTLCHAPQKPHKPQKPPPNPFLWILWFLRRVAGVRNEGRSAHRGEVRRGGHGPSSSIWAVTLSNENGPSRSRPCPHPPPAVSDGHEPTRPTGGVQPRSRLDHVSGHVWPSNGSSQAGCDGMASAELIGGRGRWVR